MPLVASPIEDMDWLIDWVAPDGGSATFTCWLDDELKTMRIVISGTWTAEHAEAYFNEQRRFAEEARRRFGGLKVFFDARGWLVKTPERAGEFQSVNDEIYGPDDRLVAVVSNFAYKQYPRMTFGEGNREVFVSMSAAETWLQAH